MSIYLIRHGETVEGKNRVLLGHHNGVLSYEALSQSKEVARKIGGVEKIITSDLSRALIFTQLIQQHKYVPYEQDIRLRERDYGVYNGEPINKLLSDFGSFDFEEAPSDGESKADFYCRIDSFYQSISSVDNIAIVSHAGVIMRLMKNYGFGKYLPKNGEVIIIR